MILEQYPKLGSTVSFVRQANTGVEEGEGRVLAIVLDPHKRLMVTVETAVIDANGHPVRHNVHVTCLEPSDEFKVQFAAALAEAQAIGEEGNCKIKEIVADYNQRVDDVQGAVLGVSVIG